MEPKPLHDPTRILCNITLAIIACVLAFVWRTADDPQATVIHMVVVDPLNYMAMHIIIGLAIATVVTWANQNWQKNDAAGGDGENRRRRHAHCRKSYGRSTRNKWTSE